MDSGCAPTSARITRCARVIRQPRTRLRRLRSSGPPQPIAAATSRLPRGPGRRATAPTATTTAAMRSSSSSAIRRRSPRTGVLCNCIRAWPMRRQTSSSSSRCRNSNSRRNSNTRTTTSRTNSRTNNRVRKSRIRTGRARTRKTCSRASSRTSNRQGSNSQKNGQTSNSKDVLRRNRAKARQARQVMTAALDKDQQGKDKTNNSSNKRPPTRRNRRRPMPRSASPCNRRCRASNNPPIGAIRSR